MSDDSKNKQPIIIVKKKSGHGGHHGGAWKVAYADFVTAMMAFFLVMWLVSQDEPVKQAVQNYFQDPAGFMKGKGQGVMKNGKSPVDSPSKGVKDVSSILERERKILVSMSQKIQESLEEMPELKGLMDYVEIEITQEGLRIQLIDGSNDEESNFFDLGSAKLKPRSSLLLTAVAKELGNVPNLVVIEGHTDSKPFSGRNDYSNWELSADRANSARKLMESAGLRAGQVVEVRGYADRLPRLTDNPHDPRNRRVAIIALNDKAAERFRII